MTIKSTRDNSSLTASACTFSFLSILAREAADKFEAEGAQSMAGQARRLANSIYEALREAGYYTE